MSNSCMLQPMVTGARGVAGVHAAELAMEGRCEGTAHVTTHVPPMEEEPVEGQIPRSRGATLTCVLVSLLIPVCGMSKPIAQ